MIAFHDSLIIPRMEERIRMDTAWVDSLTYDTIVEKKYMHYLPDDVTAVSKAPTIDFSQNANAH